MEDNEYPIVPDCDCSACYEQVKHKIEARLMTNAKGEFLNESFIKSIEGKPVTMGIGGPVIGKITRARVDKAGNIVVESAVNIDIAGELNDYTPDPGTRSKVEAKKGRKRTRKAKRKTGQKASS